MFTKEYFVTCAIEAEARYKALLKDFPPGTVNQERNDAHRDAERCLHVAAWMEANGIAECANVGPFMTSSFSRGQKVRIKKGVKVFSTAPSVSREGREQSRSQVVTVHFFDQGYIDLTEDRANPRIVQGKVTWSGTGGYWRWTDVNNVELI